MRLLTLTTALMFSVEGLNLNLPKFDFVSFSLPSNPTKPSVEPPPGFRAPPRAPLSAKASQIPSLLTGSIALGVRLGSGAFVLGWQSDVVTEDAPSGATPLGPVALSDSSTVLPSALARGIRQPLVLYEYEPSPYCKKVREVCCLLDIPVLMKPCPIKMVEAPRPSSTRGGATPYVKKERGGFSDELFKKTGRRTVPYLEDPNNPSMGGMFESEDIIDYLLDTYSDKDLYDGKALWPMRGGFADFTSTIATIARSLAGANLNPDAREDNQAMQPITIYGYECSPFVKPVRERLVELGLPHVVVPCSRGSENRAKVQELTGEQFQVPQIDDPNTNVGVFAESEAIVDYLTSTYTKK